MMLDEIGQEKSGKLVANAIQEVLKEGKIKAKDLAGIIHPQKWETQL
jgi:isocitrate/isopropylmalate dehydrogenase